MRSVKNLVANQTMSVQSQKLVTTENAWTPALLKNVGSMLSVALETTEQLASAKQGTRATPTRGAGNMSASLTQSVLTIWHVEMKNVSTPVETAQLMLTARLEITEQYASVGLATQEIHTAQFAAKLNYQRSNVQQTGTAPADNPACKRNAKTHAWP
jgi:hypothetical protein